VKLDPKTDERVLGLGKALAEGLGERVVSIAVYGSAAGDEYSPGFSDVNLLVVLREISFNDLRLIGTILAREAGSGLRLSTPLVVRPRFLERARDAFPIELHDIRERHRVIHGTDLLGGLEISPEALRRQAEREARGKLLRLRGLVIARPDDRTLQQALASAATTFLILARNLLPHRAGPRPRGVALLDEFAREHGLRLPILRRLETLRLAHAAWPVEHELDELLAGLLGEVESLVQSIDGDGA
jgi:predicted nucleotidyltransferase